MDRLSGGKDREELSFLKLAFRASTKTTVGPCGLRLTRPRRSDPSHPFAIALTKERLPDLPLTAELHSQVAVQSIVEDRRGAVWASFIPYGLAKWEGGHWTRNGGLTGLPEAWVVILNIGPTVRIWAGYMNGEVAVIDGTSVRSATR